MGRIIGLHARFAGLHYQRRDVRFGAQWRAHLAPEDALEFSEYGRAHHTRQGAWFCAGLFLASSLIWISLIALL
ncbi:MAG TPA: hypothetical protein VL026_06815 [Rhizomicrobium sp.]|nr:hypothetical protein [Rhizomicrobium sp.]